MVTKNKKKRNKRGIFWKTVREVAWKVTVRAVLLFLVFMFCIFLYYQIKSNGDKAQIPSPNIIAPQVQQQISNINSSSDLGLLIRMINESGGIPIKVTSSVQTNWSQFTISLLFGSIFFLWMFGNSLVTITKTILMKSYFRFLRGKTKRHVLFIKHTEQGLFSGSMIDQQTLNKIQKALIKFKGKPFDLILHTPGGEIFAAMFISRLLKEYPNKIRAWIPSYAMSGGTLLALSTDEVYMSPTACLGPVDPQLGSLFSYGSAAAWDRIVKFKGKKADDQSISFAMMGEQYTKSIRTHLMNTIHLNMNVKDKEKFINFITSGKVEHGFALTVGDLQRLHVPVKIMKDKGVLIKFMKFITSKGNEGVTYA
ncbi:hypothetical protein M0R04_08815 [Candidatus Dojkabacteria bacterium]|jgi:ClpP class serine protease|nr:hypothetical protein [Candidatus Dojkabacteria bacterium]